MKAEDKLKLIAYIVKGRSVDEINEFTTLLLRERDEKIKHLTEEVERLKEIAKQYAEFCVMIDREGLPLLELDGYIKLTKPTEK